VSPALGPTATGGDHNQGTTRGSCTPGADALEPSCLLALDLAPRVPVCLTSVERLDNGAREHAMKMYVDGEWSGWDGDTIVKLTNGTVWRQVE